MKKKFTIIATAVMLCAFLIPPLAMRGQTRTEVTDVLNRELTGVTGTSYTEWSNKTSNSDAVWAGQSAGGNESIQLRSNNNNSGIITTASGGIVTNVTVTWQSATAAGRTLNVYGKSTAYSSPADLYDADNQGTLIGTIVCGTSTELTIEDEYQYIGMRSANGAMYLTEIDVIWSDGGAPTPTHTLTFGANPAEGGTVAVGTNTTGTVTLAEGATPTVAATVNTGYVFSNWTVSGEGSSVADATSASTTFTMGTADATLTANFTAVSTYIVTYYANVVGIAPVEVEYNESEDVTVAANTFTNPGYAFTKWNTLEGGTGTDYMPGDVIENINADIDLYAQWEESNEMVDVLNLEATGSPTNYTVWTYTAPSGAEYAGQSSGNYNSIQLRSNNNNSGIVTTIPAGLVTKVAVTWNSNTANGRTLNVYGKNTAYEAATDLYNTDNAGDLLGTIVCGTSTELTIGNEYQYIGMRSASGALYLEEIQITWTNGSGVTPPSITANNVEIAYDATEGAIEYTINNGVDGGVLSAATEAEWLTIGTVGETVPFTCTVNDNGQRAATVTLTYTYNTDQTATKNVTVTQDGNPNGPGSQNNPYTVAQARAAIDAGAGTQGVYATGIVSAIPTAYNSSYSNITFNMVDQEGDEEFLQAYRCGGEEAANVAVGDVVVVYGNLIKYGSTYEFGQGCEVVSLTHPAVTTPTITVTPATVNVDAELHAEQLPITYENIVVENYESFGVQFYDAEGEETEMPTTWLFVGVTEDLQNPGNYQVTCAIMANEGEARSAYLKVYAYDEESNVVYSNLVTINQEEYVAPTYAELPFSFNSGRADIETTDGLYQEGLGTDYNASTNPNTQLKFDGTGDWLLLQFSERPGTLTFDIKGNGFSDGTFTVQTSENGVTYEDLIAYTELGSAETKTFDALGENVRYIKWIYTNKASGNVGLGNITLAEYVEPVIVASITVNPDVVDVDAEEHDGTLDLTYENLTISGMTDFDIQYFDATGEEALAPDWIEVVVAEQDPAIGEGYVVSYYMMENDGEARTAYFKVYAMDDASELVYSNIVTVNQDAYVAPVPTEDYALFTGDLIEGDYLIVYDNRAMNTTVTGDRLQFDNVEPENDVIATNNAAIIWHIAPSGDYWTIYNAEANAYAAGTGVKNKAQMLADGTDDKALWTVSGMETFEFVNKANAAAGVNANLRNNGTYGFACYATGTGGALTLYKKVTSTVTYNKEISGYGESEGGYYLIASPIYGLNPANVAGMTDVTTSDLYYFDQTQEAEWRNYKAHAFYLTPGKGYLYAKTEDVTLTFAGMPYEGNGIVNLTYDEAAQFAGWNLIGNPFGTNASLNMPYYRLNSDGSEVSASLESTNVAVMEGVFVEATETVLTATFTASRNAEQQGIAQANIMVSGDRGTVIDNAIVRFDGGATLGKFQLNENSTKLYISQNGSDYAVVRSTAEGEMPVNFKANRNGSYTITINTENVKMDYLHLIDNMTGADVDLLQTPSYSFEARTTDYATRFRLVFSANNVNENESGDSFAFFNGSEWVVNTSNNATLQVVDAMGRVLSSETISGSESVSLNAALGVYMLRLINGNGVKVQKIVVR